MNDLIAAALRERDLRAGEMPSRWRPAFHITAPAGWINDPNGLAWFAGEYHVFYQHHPFSSHWGPMYWGHVTSTDLVHWRHAGVALAPGEPYDRDGVHSGSAVVDRGELVVAYTGHLYRDPDPQTRHLDDFTQTQNIATSRDGFTFTKDPANPVLDTPPEGSTHHWRDPKLWRHAGSWYMILGNGMVGGRGRALLYRSADLRAWEYLGVVAESDGSTGFMWECPDLFALDGWDVLLISPMGMYPETPEAADCGALIGHLDYQAPRLTHGPYVPMDHGHDFYAVQSMLTPDGRRVAFAWMTPRVEGGGEQVDGWAGILSLPRELRVDAAGHLLSQPVAELAALRRAVLLEQPLTVSGSHITDVAAGVAEIRLSADLDASKAERVGLEFRHEAGQVAILWDRTTGVLELDRGGPDGIRRVSHDPGAQLALRVFLDRSSVEVFTGSGEVSLSSRIYPEGPPTLVVVSTGGETSMQVRVDELADIWQAEH